MKTPSIVFTLFLTGIASLQAGQASTGSTSPLSPVQGKTLPEPTAPAIVTRDANSRVWEHIEYEKSPTGQILAKKHHTIEVASGMHYQDAKGEWVESKEEIEAYSKGAIARQGQYQVIFANNLNTAGSIDMQTPDGKRLRSSILGLSYYDTTAGKSVLIAQIQNSQGELTSDNQVLYPNAFEGVKADVRYTYKKGSFEQDVILREQPPTPESFGLDPRTTIIQVMTEFLSPPQEAIKESVARSGALPDQDISWGAMRLGHGKAFELAEAPNQKSKVRVMREYVTLDARKILLEKVPLVNIAPAVSKLPKQASLKFKLPMTAAKELPLPKTPVAQLEPKPMRVASVGASTSGYVLDYVFLNTDTNDFTFQGDETYYVSGEFNLTGKTTFEGGTVIKCDPGCQIDIDAYGTIDCQTTAYRPAVFSSVNDDSVGDPGFWTSDPYYTGSPAAGDVDTFLNVNCANPILRNMRFCYAGQAVNVKSSAGNIDLWDCQFMNAHICIWSENANVNLHNVLMQGVLTYSVYLNYGGNYLAENVTSDGFSNDQGIPFLDDGKEQTVNMTNSLATLGSYVSVNGQTPEYSSDPIYQTVGAGSFYLATNSPYRNVGTTNLTSGLWDDLRQKTTYPPRVYEGTSISIDTTYSPQAERDTHAPDLGYHYPPLDYVFSDCSVSANLTVTEGTAIGSLGIYLNDGASLTMTGTASAPCWFTSPLCVQEGGNGTWNTFGGPAAILFEGSGALPLPELKATFTKWTALRASRAHFQDDWAFGVARLNDCEFYNVTIASYSSSYYFTNCLFHRVYTAYWDQMDAANLTYQNCTFFNGFLALCRYSGQTPSFWTIKNTMFDGTGFLYDDNFHANASYTYFDYNAYNTNNNSSWVTYNSGYWSDPTLETIGPHDVSISIPFTWQSSWLGDFYQPTNSPLIDAGSPTANQVGLYHFTTQTNQVKEANSTVDIGYHYVAVDNNGVPIDTNGNGIPDYEDDANGNGLIDSGEVGWNLVGDLGLNVIISRPRNGSTLP